MIPASPCPSSNLRTDPPVLTASIVPADVERKLLGRVVRTALDRLEDEQTPATTALSNFRHFVGGLAFFLEATEGWNEADALINTGPPGDEEDA